MTEVAGGRTPQKKVHLLDTQRGLPNLSTIGREESPVSGAMVHSQTSDKRSKKRERARRNLVDTLSAKRPSVVSPSRGVTYACSDRKLPPAFRLPGPDISVRKKDLIGLQYDPRANYQGQRNGTEIDFDEFPEHRTGGDSRMLRSSQHHKSTSNLPQLLRDLNSSLKYSQRRDDCSLSSDDDGIYNGEDILQALSLSWSKRSKEDKHKQWLQYRPITPSLLEKLDKLKMSSRSRTEQWINQIPTEKRSYHSPLYRLGNVSKDDAVTSPAVYESWIYEETRKSARGVRKPRLT